MSDLNVALIQTDLIWEDKSANLSRLEEHFIRLSGDEHLVVLPEMFSTGFSMQPEKLGEPMNGPSVEWLREQAAEHQTVITGSLIIEEDGNYYNRLIWMRPDRTYETYDKHHLFTMAEEQTHYTPGSGMLTVELNGWKIRPLVCYDLRFPVWCRNTDAYDCVLFVANWPERRSVHWRTLLAARAVENQAFVIGVNRVGKDGNGIAHRGDSGIFSPVGECIVKSSYTELVMRATLERNKITKTRRHMPFLNDRDEFELKDQA